MSEERAPDLEDPYGRVTARYYDEVYAKLRNPSGDRQFYLELARELRGPVLELGCGTGRVLLPIAQEGFPCTGLDPSPSMLDALRSKNPPGTLRLVRARMQEFDLGGDRFSLIFTAFRAFQHLVSVEDQLGCLECVRRHLAPDGAFAFDVFAPKLDRIALNEEPEQEDARFEKDGEEIVRYAGVERDPALQRMRVAMRYERWRGGKMVGEDRVEFTMRYFYRYEIEHLLARAGFTDVTFYGAFDRRPFDYYGGEILAVARLGRSSGSA
jgi:SAM-dependent methyltransferase